MSCSTFPLVLNIETLWLESISIQLSKLFNDLFQKNVPYYQESLGSVPYQVFLSDAFFSETPPFVLIFDRECLF
jgi:hypothetical protein